MNEQLFLATGVVFVVLVTVAMLRVEARRGGAAWAASWICLYLSGMAALFAERWPALGPLYAVLGTCFAALLWIGARYFAGKGLPGWFLPVVGGVVLVRAAAHPFLPEAGVQVVGSSLVTLGALWAAWEVGKASLTPEGSAGDCVLATSFTLLAATSWVYAWWKVTGTTANGFYLWLVAGILVSGLQTGALMARVSRSVERGRGALAALFDSVPIGLVLSGVDGAVKVTNRVMAEMVGGEPADAWPRRPVADLLARLDPGRPSAPASLADPWAGVRNEELRPSDQRVIEAQGRPVEAEDGEIVGRLILARDVTHERRMQEQLQRSGRLETLGRLAGGIAHDFNNKLTTVLGNAALVRSSLPPGHPQHAALADLESAAIACADLTNDLLDFSKRGPRALRPVALAPLLEQLAGEFASQLGDDVKLEIQIAPDLGLLRADPKQLERVLTNLMLNARDAVGQSGRVALSAARARRTRREVIEIAISDDGTGMDDETRQRIFDPFFSTKGSGTVATGLGLAIVHGIVASHDGEIHVESLPGRGTRVVTTWPTA